MLNRATVTAAIGLLGLSVAASAQPFRLTGPRVSKLDWSTRAMRAGDLDGDGRTDLAVLNNDLAQIELLYQRTAAEIREVAPRKVGSKRWEPIIENAPFLRENELTGDFMYDLLPLDVDLDGRLDLVYTGKRDRLAAKLQTAPGEFEGEWYFDKSEPSANSDTLCSADVDADGDLDLIALAKDAIHVFLLAPGATVFPEPKTYRVNEENPQKLKVRDLNGDGRVDIAYLSTSSDRALRVRYQHEDGGFGPEFAIPVRVGAADWDVTTNAAGAARLVTIKPTRSEIQLSPLKTSTGARRQSLDIRNYPVPKSGANPALFAIGDFDGDALKDVAVADSDGSAVYLYTQDETGEFRRPREFPCLNGVTSLAPILRKGQRDALLVCSEKEGMVGISTVGEAGRLSFPESLTVEGEPLVAAAPDLDGDGSSEIVVAIKDGRRASLEIFKLSDGGAYKAAGSVKLGSLKRNPTAILGRDLDSDGDADIAMFVPREPARFFRHEGALKFEEVGEKDSLRTSQFEGVLLDRFTMGDFDGDGRDEIVVASKGYVRAYRLTEAGELQIVDQANARSSLDELSGPLLFDIDRDGQPELTVYHPNEASIQVLEKDASGLFSYSRSLDAAPIGLEGAVAVDLGGAAGVRLIVFGKDRFWSIPARATDDDAASDRSSYRTDLEDVQYSLFTLGDLNHDGTQEIIAIDSNSHVLDVLERTDEGWRSAMFFRVFDDNRFVNAGRRAPLQPREVLIGDFNNDQRDDLVLLCHDRVLLYPHDDGDADD